MSDLANRFRSIGIVPVVVLEDPADAVPLARALMDGGLPCAEVTFRTAAAAEAIRSIHKTYPEMLVGAGTVLSAEQVDKALEAGAQFIVSPGLNPEVVRYCQSKGVPVTPGVQTPSEMELAMSLGLDFVKFFPAEPAGGLKYIKAVCGPYTGLQFMPTGGVNTSNVREYLAFDRIVAAGGSWMVPKNLIAEGKFSEITALVKDAAAIVKEVRG